MKRIVSLFLGAVAFMTRLPVRLGVRLSIRSGRLSPMRT